MMLKGMTAQYLLRRTFKVQKGDTILVHAAAGGVGLILCQWGKHLGATVIGTVGSPDKAELAKANGAHHTILYNKEDFAAKVKEITGGKLCDVVYDGVGKTTFPGSLDCLRPMGMFVSYGSASGQIDAFNINLLQFKGSLFATRPTLNHYAAKRADLLDDRRGPVRCGRLGRGENPREPDIRAERRPQGTRGPRRPQDHGIVDPGAVSAACRFSPHRLPEIDVFCRAAFCWNMTGRPGRRREVAFSWARSPHTCSTPRRDGRPRG